MNEQNISDQQQESITDFYVPDEDKIRLLQTILESESGICVSFDEAEEIGIQLIGLYECLARDRTIIPRREHV